MFQNLRAGSSVYILHKNGNPVLDTGTIVNVSKPMPKYSVPPMFGQPQEMVVDILVRVNNQERSFPSMPSTSDITEIVSTGEVFSDSREAMNAEVVNLKNNSLETIGSIDFHKGVVESCNKILESLNPEFAERQAQQNEINALKEQMQELMKMNRDLLSKLGSDHKK